MHIEQEIEINIKLQAEVVKQIKETKKQCNEYPQDKILLFKFSMLMHQYDLYNHAINDLKKN